MAGVSLMELSTRMERAALALRDADQEPTVPRLAVVIEDIGHTCRHLSHAATRFAAWLELELPGRDLRELVACLERCEAAAATAAGVLIELGRRSDDHD